MREREKEREKLSNHKVFETLSVLPHAWGRFVVVDARQKQLDVVGPNEGIFERPCIVFV